MLTNARLSLHALLSNCCVDDTRSSKAANPVKRYMQRKSSSDLSYPIDGDEPATDSDKSSFRSMIDVTFEKDGNDTRGKPLLLLISEKEAAMRYSTVLKSIFAFASPPRVFSRIFENFTAIIRYFLILIIVDAHIYSFVLIFNVDHVTKIQEFFLSELTNNETDIHSKSSKKHEVTAPVRTCDKVTLHIDGALLFCFHCDVFHFFFRPTPLRY